MRTHAARCKRTAGASTLELIGSASASWSRCAARAARRPHCAPGPTNRAAALARLRRKKPNLLAWQGLRRDRDSPPMQPVNQLHEDDVGGHDGPLYMTIGKTRDSRKRILDFHKTADARIVRIPFRTTPRAATRAARQHLATPPRSLIQWPRMFMNRARWNAASTTAAPRGTRSSRKASGTSEGHRSPTATAIPCPRLQQKHRAQMRSSYRCMCRQGSAASVSIWTCARFLHNGDRRQHTPNRDPDKTHGEPRPYEPAAASANDSAPDRPYPQVHPWKQLMAQNGRGGRPTQPAAAKPNPRIGAQGFDHRTVWLPWIACRGRARRPSERPKPSRLPQHPGGPPRTPSMEAATCRRSPDGLPPRARRRGHP